MTLLEEISISKVDFVKSIALFYIIILGNFVPGIFTCSQKKFINSSKFILILITFMVFFFIVTIVSDTGNNIFIPPIQKLMYTILYFIIFLFSMRMDLRITLIILSLLILVYFIELNKTYYLNTGDQITNMEEKSVYQDHAYWITLDFPTKIRLFPVKPDQFEFVNKLETIIYYVVVVLIILGVIAYRGEITETLHKKTDVSWFDIVIDTNECKITDRLPLSHYIKAGLGYNIRK
jgi:hypothetical protein